MGKNYAEAIGAYLLKKSTRVLKDAYGALKYPLIDPGEGYVGNLWDWDSYWTAYALFQAFDTIEWRVLEKAGLSREKVIAHAKGCVENFLDAQCKDGFTPILIAAEGLFSDLFVKEHAKGASINQMKPFLCQAAHSVCAFEGNYGWVNVNKLIAYMGYYERTQKDEATGLFFWENDVMIGVDNNPTVYFRPNRTCADIYLNSFMYAEYLALAQILRRLNDKRAQEYQRKAEELKTSVNDYMWDEKDGIYYSQDLNFRKDTACIGEATFHAGLLPTWKTMPLRIRFWGCFLPMYVGICDKEKAKRLVKHLKQKEVVGKYGVRTLASDEPMYSLEKSSNPSNWLGAVWTVASYCVWKGLKNYKFKAEAEKLRKKTIKLLGENIIERGDMFESYHPDTGEPNLYPGFLSWNLLAFELIRK